MSIENQINEQTTKILNQLDNFQLSLIGALLFNYVPTELTNRAVQKSADYAEKNMPDAIILSSNSKNDMWDCAISKLNIDGYIAEFGVWKGESINYLANLIYPKKIFGFDSFFGLEEDFPLDRPKGSFSLNGDSPEVMKNVEIIKGSFSTSLPTWIKNNPGKFAFINIDCDTYESTKMVLNSIGKKGIVPGTLILFDEYFGYHNWEKCEFKAWQEYCSINNIKYKYVAICQLQVLVEVIE